MERKRGKVLVAIGILMCATIQASDPVKVCGAVHVPSSTGHPVVIALIGEDGDTLALHETRTGHFRLRLPAERLLTLRFNGSGCMSKDVVIDTHHALGHGSRLRKLDFGVELYATPEQPAHYSGAVGTIAFAPGTNRLKVRHHCSVVHEP